MVSEQDYITGSRAAWLDMFQTCLGHLGYDFGAVAGDQTNPHRLAWIVEREQCVQALRSICADFGDNDWDEKLSLADVIEKHLARHLEESENECIEEFDRTR